MQAKVFGNSAKTFLIIQIDYTRILHYSYSSIVWRRKRCHSVKLKVSHQRLGYILENMPDFKAIVTIIRISNLKKIHDNVEILYVNNLVPKIGISN